MSRMRNNKGFTLAEIMMAVAIIAILAGVSFVGVIGYLRSMAQLERDNIAKEIFVAAQNHLTMAEGQNYMGRTEKGVEDFETDEDGNVKKIYYYIVNAGTVTAGGANAFGNGLLGIMLPFGSIDETIRGGGNYVIRYQAEPANVLDVFYSPGSSSGKRFIYPLTKDNYSTVKAAAGESNKTNRKRFPGGSGDGVIGWYGGGEGLEKGEEIKTPDITVTNAETLRVEVTDYNPVTTPLQLIITGVTSGAQKAIKLRTQGDRVSLISSSTSVNKYGITLDDITDWDLRFRNLGADNGSFLPGEDITIQAVAYRNDVLTNVGYSATKKTNSLFAKMDMQTETNTDAEGGVTTNILSSTASVTNIRHLQNLEKEVSLVHETLKLNAANQKTDLSWNTFLTELGKKSAQIYLNSTNKEETGYYHPVSVTYPLAYDGMGHRISDVLIKHNGDKGVFGTYGADSISSIKNLAIVDLKMEAIASGNTGNAGALVGSIENTAVTNVVAYNSSTYANNNNILTSGSAGGLIGSMSGGSVTACAAALFVESEGGNAGGLVGTTNDSTVITGCYAGGHTSNGEYYNTTAGVDGDGNPTSTKTPIYNVSGTGSAGGLVGAAGGATISSSYSTCSATGGIAGGLIGSGTGNLTNCYATGLVMGTTTEGAFAGTYSSGTASGCKYYEIINERSRDTEGYAYLPSVSGSDSEHPVAGIEPLDKDAETYNTFVGGTWSNKVLPYDDKLREYYQNQYNLQTVTQLGYSVPTDKPEYIEEYFVETHYGDWPAPEIFVINTK